jgi:hypothetical protein
MKDFIFLVVVEKTQFIQDWDAGFADPPKWVTVKEHYTCNTMEEVEKICKRNEGYTIHKYDCFKRF